MLQAFGSVASIEAAYFAKTGKQLLLSEQNLIDCAWDYGNTGCLGGFQALAYNYMAATLHIASEEVRRACNCGVPRQMRMRFRTMAF